MTEQEWQDLDQQYRAVFGYGIPRSMLPADESSAAELVRKAIKARDESILDADLPPGVMI